MFGGMAGGLLRIGCGLIEQLMYTCAWDAHGNDRLPPACAGSVLAGRNLRAIRCGLINAISHYYNVKITSSEKN